MSTSSDTSIWSQPRRVADLPSKRPTQFDVTPDATTLAAIKESLGLLGLRKLRFKGEIAPESKSGWRLTGQLGATVDQPCVLTLVPVTTRLDEDVIRRFVTEMEEFETGGETQMPEDDSIEILGPEIDLGEIMVESLALALPLYPKAEGVEVETTVFAEPGVTPMKDEDTRPFAGLKGLRDRLEDKGN
ncbi:MAG: YceD family protein [Marinosulfonomonas sp.]